MKIIMSYLEEDEKLKKCLDSLQKFSPSIEIIKLKADKTTNISEEVFQKYFDENGFNDDYMIWHPDMIATKGWYENLLKHWNKFDIIGCKLLYPDGLVQHFGGNIFKDGRGFHHQQFCLNIGLNTPLETAFVTGPSMIIKKRVWEKLGGWDFDFQYYIDVDFCVRARQLGFTVGVVPVELIHSEGEDAIKKRSERKTSELQEKGLNLFINKHIKWLSKFK